MLLPGESIGMVVSSVQIMLDKIKIPITRIINTILTATEKVVPKWG